MLSPDYPIRFVRTRRSGARNTGYHTGGFVVDQFADGVRKQCHPTLHKPSPRDWSLKHPEVLQLIQLKDVQKLIIPADLRSE